MAYIHIASSHLFQRKAILGEIVVSAEKHKGRLVVRFETPDDVVIG